LGAPDAKIARIRYAILDVQIANGVFEVIPWQALQTLHTGAILVAVVDDAGQPDRHKGAQSDGVIGAIDGDEAQHESTAAAAVQNLVFSHCSQRKSGN